MDYGNKYDRSDYQDLQKKLEREIAEDRCGLLSGQRYLGKSSTTTTELCIIARAFHNDLSESLIVTFRIV